MIDKLNNALQFQQQALALRAQRHEVLSGNIANADTPNYKARDFNFAAELKRATASQSGGGLQLATTSHGHLTSNGANGVAPQMQYRAPSQSRMDGNTVEMDIERTHFLDNSLRYQADIQFFDDRITGMRKAMQSER
ncbi:flagellar basal body rod protein FlgB [Pseudidiomarina sp.]|uniref:flagellar basal body rod protein FlgB n=1 Tax=Pseudidiomarina sp. TaxID=2081707 RepID=UPI00299E9DFC|nr:flagellar basal body rod protein FlgB [Pseudidiomarina sp.]MDX1705778.1 flagellar basal body rod protein FlgB [Pseudidiomarina sp.]